jgi:hypothetical protein
MKKGLSIGRGEKLLTVAPEIPMYDDGPLSPTSSPRDALNSAQALVSRINDDPNHPLYERARVDHHAVDNKGKRLRGMASVIVTLRRQ